MVKHQLIIWETQLEIQNHHVSLVRFATGYVSIYMQQDFNLVDVE